MLDGMGRLQSRRRDEQTDPGVLALVDRLRKLADERVKMRSLVEQRWLEDLQHFHGQYDDATQAWLAKSENKNKSRLFINLTRPKTNAMISRIMDLLFPTDDKHWGIQPSPVPEMGRQETEAQNIMDRFKGVAQDAQERFDDPEETDELKLQEAGETLEVANANMKAAQEAIDDLADMRKEAKLACQLMEEEIYDQLKASSYQAQCRDVIEDACKLGSGVMKGPVLAEKVRKRWVMNKDTGKHELTEVLDIKPAFERVDPWAFFPDANARTMEESEGDLERHMMNRKQLRELARRSDMDKEAINNLLKSGMEDIAPEGMSQLFALTNDEAHQIKGKFQVWEYTGPVEPEELALLADAYEDGDTLGELEYLEEVHAKIWFCQNEVLSFALHPLESNEGIYSVYNIEKSETYVLGGIGMPRLIRDPQKALNSAHRMMMDNARIAVGPQIVVNQERITPKNDSWELSEMKIWMEQDGISERPAFEIYNIPLNQALLANIIEMARRDIDEMSSMPMIAQGEQGAGVTKTAQGMAMLMNSANVNFRRYIRNWDDDITVPNIRRTYDFNMQFSNKEEIKGDYEVDARGSTVLLVREMQAANLMHLADRFGEHPEYGVYIDKPELLKQVVKANMIPADGLIRTEREAEELRQQQAKQPDPTMVIAEKTIGLKEKEIDSRVAIAEMNNDTKLRVEDKEQDGKMQVAVMNASEKAEDREARLEIEGAKTGDKSSAAAIKREFDERKLATEVATALKTGVHANGDI